MTIAEFSTTVHDASGSPQALDCDSDILATNTLGRDEEKALWSSIVDQPLIDWGLHPGNVDEDGLVSPAGEAIATAYGLVDFMRQEGEPVPTAVIPDGEGGIVFENKVDPIYQRFEIDNSGRLMFLEFENCKLRLQQKIEFVR